MPKQGPAVFGERDGRASLRFERSLPQPPERVWDALTQREEMLDWHPTPCELEPSAGGRVSFPPAADAPEMPAGRVLAYDPPRLLAYTWGEDELRFELSADGDGCVLTLTHSFGDRFKAARDAAGWHICLAALERSLAGIARDPDGPRLQGDWQTLNRDYQRRFGISPEQATPVPER